MEKIRVFEAFAGYGSTAMAMKRQQKDFPDKVEYEFVGISEIEPNAITAYNAVHGETKNYGDISKINWEDVPDFDLFTYSFPCQDISNAGKQAGFAEGSGSRSSLLWECEKAIVAKQPKYLLMENVKALVSQKFMPDFRKWIDRLSDLGYESFWKVLNARDYGVPQNRERVFMISILNNDPEKMYHFPKKMKLGKRLKDILESNVDEKYYKKGEQLAKIVKTYEPNYEIKEITPFNIPEDGIAPTITTMYARLGTNNLTPEGHHGAMGIIEPVSCASRKRGDVHKLEIRKDDVANCVTSIDTDSMIAEPRVLTPLRTEEGRQLRKQGIEKFSNRALYPREDGVSNTITSVQKDNLLVEPTFLRGACGYGSPAELNIPSAVTASGYQDNNFIKEPTTECLNYYDENGVKRHQQDRIYSEDGIAVAVTTSFHSNIATKDLGGCYYKGKFIKEGDGLYTGTSKDFVRGGLDGISRTLKAEMHDAGVCVWDGKFYRIRGLTPRELFRLMDVSEEDIDKIQNAGISKTAQCVLAGNSIVVSCIYWLLFQLFVDNECKEQQLSLF